MLEFEFDRRRICNANGHQIGSLELHRKAGHRSLARGLPGAALALLLCLLLCLLFGWSGAAAQALEDPTRWTLTDQGGDRWGLVLLQQVDPAYPPGWRLRLIALGGQPPLDHQRPLRLKDGQGGAWQLANRSRELVPEGAAPLPPASAQFEIEGLEPAPKGFLPLRLVVPLASDGPGPVAELTLGAQVVEALRKLALQQLVELPASSLDAQPQEAAAQGGCPQSRAWNCMPI
jgi:hypothetical protein